MAKIYESRYLETQISEVDKKLELQWDMYRENNGKKTGRGLKDRSLTSNLFASVLNLRNKRISCENELSKISQKLKKLTLGSPPLAVSEPIIKRETAGISLVGGTPLERKNQVADVLKERKSTPVRKHCAPKISKVSSMVK